MRPAREAVLGTEVDICVLWSEHHFGASPRIERDSEQPWSGGRSITDLVFTSAAVGDLVSWSVDGNGRVFPAHGGAADEPYAHVIMDRGGIEWTVREVDTPQPWARGRRCLVLNSRECVRRLWHYPRDWRSMDADRLLELGIAD